jgi:hypothetical protein
MEYLLEFLNMALQLPKTAAALPACGEDRKLSSVEGFELS